MKFTKFLRTLSFTEHLLRLLLKYENLNSDSHLLKSLFYLLRVAHKNVSIFLWQNFCKNKETCKIFSPQLLEVYRILLMETTLESIMFYYTFSIINTTFVPCSALLYDSTAATRTLKLSTTLLSISCGIRLISFLMMSSLVCGLSSQTLSFSYPLRKQSGGFRSWE